MQRPSMDNEDDVGGRKMAQHPSNLLQGASILSSNKKAAPRDSSAENEVLSSIYLHPDDSEVKANVHESFSSR